MLKKNSGLSQMRQNSGTLLTQDQRQSLDDAIAAKKTLLESNLTDSKWVSEQYQKKGYIQGVPEYSQHKTHKSFHKIASDRVNKTGRSMRTKKGGAGGKYTWGGPLVSGDGKGFIDHSDPNYDSEVDDEEQNGFFLRSEPVAEQVSEFKSEIKTMLQEYFDSGDLLEVVETLQDRDLPQLHHYVIKEAIKLSMGRGDKEKEMTSILLSGLHGEVIAPYQVQKGFESLIESLEDLLLDVPSGIELLSLFICRAIVEDALAAQIVDDLGKEKGENYEKLKQQCLEHLSKSREGVNLAECWGTGTANSFHEVQARYQDLIQDYLQAGDEAKAAQQLREMKVPFCNHEFVRLMLVKGLELEDSQDSLIKLLKYSLENGQISVEQMNKGFMRVTERLSDIEKSVPQASTKLPALLSKAKKAELTSPGEQGKGSHLDRLASGLDIDAIKRSMKASLKEYFYHQDAGEFIEQIRELKCPGMHHVLLKQAVSLSLDYQPSERELISRLLVHLSPEVLPPDQIELGFTNLLHAADDLTLDSPSAPHDLALFLSRAVVDEIVPPVYLTHVAHTLPVESMGLTVLSAAGKMLSARHASERLQTCWGKGLLSVEEQKQSMKALVQEFVSSNDLKEAERCLSELNVPHFHHQLVKLAMEAAFDQPAQKEMLSKLLQALEASAEISQTQMQKGFKEVEDNIADYALDYPNAKDVFASIKERAIEEGWLVAATD